ncbi:MAG TPA: cytochrome c [Miltoncostaeaceae bacterium]|jgi:mono/diheme cytochrome c family protein|nr:cytochrome c [Miltoncostaeaceae bacterium]
MNLPLRPRHAVSAALAAAALALAGCGGQPEADVANGKQLFTGACGGCHTLADAGTNGSQQGGVGGPNLDDAWRGARQSGFEDSFFRSVVHRWIYDAQPPMPRELVTGQDAHDVAAYVASVAGRSEDSESRPARPWPPEDAPRDYDQTRGQPDLLF